MNLPEQDVRILKYKFMKKYNYNVFGYVYFCKISLTLMGVLAPESVHLWPSPKPPIDLNRIFLACLSAVTLKKPIRSCIKS